MIPAGIAVPLGSLSLLIVLTNGCVCVLVYMYTSLRSYTNGFVVSLAVSDILRGALLLPLYISVPTFPLTGYIVSAVLLAGVANVCAVTFDRYLAIKRPFVYYIVMAKHFSKIIVASWVVPVLISLIPLCWSSEKVRLAHKIYMFMLQGLCVVLPYVFVFVAYFQIFQQARDIVRRLRRESLLGSCSKTPGATTSRDVSSEAKVAKIFAVIAISFILSWMPVIYLTSLDLAVRDYQLVTYLSPKWLLDSSLFTIALGSMVNPVIYSFFKPDFREIIRGIVHKSKRDKHVIDVVSILKRLESGKRIRETDL